MNPDSLASNSLNQEEMLLVSSWRRTTPAARHYMLDQLLRSLSVEDRQAAEFDASQIDWTHVESRQSLNASGKRSLSPSDAEPSHKRHETFQPRSLFERSQNPSNLINCAVKLAEKDVAGTIVEDNGLQGDGIQWGLFLNCGPYGPPCVKLKLRHKSKDMASVTWGIDAWYSGRWVIDGLKFERVADHLDDNDINNAVVRRQMATLPDKNHLERRLWCMTMQIQGNNEQFMTPQIKTLLQTVTDGKASIDRIWTKKPGYPIRIWFLLPHTNLKEDCLDVLQDLFMQRIQPLALAQDRRGMAFRPCKPWHHESSKVNRGQPKSISAQPLQANEQDQPKQASEDLADQAPQEMTTATSSAIDSGSGPIIEQAVESFVPQPECLNSQVSSDSAHTKAPQNKETISQPAMKPSKRPAAKNMFTRLDPFLVAASRRDLASMKKKAAAASVHDKGKNASKSRHTTKEVEIPDDTNTCKDDGLEEGEVEG